MRAELHRAAYTGDLPAVTSLISRGAKLNEREDGIVTPLHAAAYMGHADVCAALIDAGASLINVPKMGNPLHVAMGRHHPEVVKLLLEKSPRMLQEPDDHGLTPVHVAVISDYVEGLRYALEAGVKLADD